MMVFMKKIRCNCGGKLIQSQCEVEFFGIDFGIKKCEICKDCNAEYLDTETMQDIENEVKKRGIFGLGKLIKVTKSGNSIVIRIPPEIAKFSDITYKSIVRIFPVSKNRIEVEVAGK